MPGEISRSYEGPGDPGDGDAGEPDGEREAARVRDLVDACNLAVGALNDCPGGSVPPMIEGAVRQLQNALSQLGLNTEPFIV